MVRDVQTKVHPPETTDTDDELQPLWDRELLAEPVQCFRHSGWKADRSKVWDAMLTFLSVDKRLTRFATCGLHPHVYRSQAPPFRYKVAGDSCRDRFCVPCARQRGNLIAANILAKLAGKPCRFLTLTLRSTSEPLRELLDKIGKAFRSLRSTDTWKRAVSGGVVFLEAKWKPESNRWHVHLHALLQGSWIDKPALEADWCRITGGSYVCDLQHCPESSKVTKYVVKYCAKPYDHSVVGDPRCLIETMVAFRGRRLFTTFGDWRGVPLTKSDDDSRWENLGLLTDMIADARAGSHLAVAILTEINADATAVALRDEEPRPPPTPTLPTFPPIVETAPLLFADWHTMKPDLVHA
jgi:hypothetical protein